MIIDFNHPDTAADLATDICIIGAGAAGITLAREFAGASHDVCLLESGGISLETDTQDLYAAENVGLPRTPHDETRLRYFGGTTNHWSGHCAPFSEEDFEPRDWVPFSGWPIRRADLLPYYKRAYGICELASAPFENPQSVTQGRTIPDLDPNRLSHYFLQYSPPTRFGSVYKADLEQAKNVRVLLHANVTDIVANDDAQAVEHIKLRTLDGRDGKVRAKRVVLCCGGIENARLLLLSNGVMNSGLGNQYDVVGRYFMDHPFGKAGLVQRSGGASLDKYFSAHEISHHKYLFGLALSSGAQRRDEVLGCGIQFWPNTDYAPSALLGTGPDSPDVLDRAVIEFNRRWHNLKRNLSGPEPRDQVDFYDLMIVAEQAPSPHSRISLTAGRDRLGLNQARIDWRLSSIDRKTLDVAVRSVATEFGRLGLGHVRMEDWFQDQLGWAHSMRDYNHHMGATRMADNPKFGVVDRNCRVHGLQNLFIAGSSVFPTSSCVNPTLTIVALALRLGDHLKQETR